MTKKPIFAIFAFLMIAVVMVPPAKAWEYQDGVATDTNFEEFGPRADKLLIKLYAAAEPEWDALARGEIDVTDWPLTKPYYDLFTSSAINPNTGLPYNETINTISYGAEHGLRLLDINNNNNQFLGNPPNPAYPNPVYPNPCSVKEFRQAIAHLADRSQLDTIIGEGFYEPLYTVVPPYMGTYSHPEIRPGGALQDLTYPYSRAAAETLLDENGFPVNSSTGWRYWDRDYNNLEDPSEYLELEFWIRSDDLHRRAFGNFLADELNAVKVRVKRIYPILTRPMMTKDFHLYTGGWGLGDDPDHLIIWNWDFYCHPGYAYNYAGINNANFNQYSYGVAHAETYEEAKTNALLAQEVFASEALSVPLWDYTGNMAMSTRYTGGTASIPIGGDGEDPYRGRYWNGTVNEIGYGLDSFGSFLNMHPQGYGRGAGDMTIRYGFKVPRLYSLNPIYAEWTWDWKVMELMYESLLIRDPYDSAHFEPWLAESFEVGTYVHPVFGTCTKVKFTLRPEATWADGTPITVADVYFTFVELRDILAARGLPPPWWYSNVNNILSFTVLDPYNFEVLLDVKSAFATGWIGGNIILPKHVWKLIAESGPIESFAPDPNTISSGPWRFVEYEENSHVLLRANRLGSIVQTSLAGSTPIRSPQGYSRWQPLIAEMTLDGARNAKVDYFKQPKTINYTILNNYLSGPVTFNLNIMHPDGTMYTGTHSIGSNSNISWSWTGEIKGKKTVNLIATILDPQELAGTYQWSRVLYATIKEDEAGSTLYDDIGWSTYPFRNELPSFDIKVDIKDIALAAKAFGSYPGHPRWNSAADDNQDYKIDIKDIAAKAKKFGWVG